MVTAMKTFLSLLLFTSSQAFSPSRGSTPSLPATQLSALWRRWLPQSDELSSCRMREDGDRGNIDQHEEMDALNFFLASLLAFVCVVGPTAGAQAVSGGGLDFAGLDLSGQDFASKNYKGKDFTQVIAKGTNFAKSNLQGCRFYKSYLVNADFTGADISGASLEDTSMDGASLKDTVAKGSYFSKSILDAATLENADFTDAQFPPKVTPLLCEREDMKGTNPTTGANTRESAVCL